VDVASLALKSGNAVILRGGKETLRTNQALGRSSAACWKQNGLPPQAVQFIDSPDRALVLELLKLHEYVDIIIPRGAPACTSSAVRIAASRSSPAGPGICHIFVDESADLGASLPVIHNAKTQRPLCLQLARPVLVHRAVAADFLPRLVEFLAKTA